MWLIVGLGNPGSEYQHHRHNIGFMAVDAVMRHFDAPATRKKFSGELSDISYKGEKIYFLKPQTYMNLSGQAVGECARFFKIPPEQIIVFHDELDLPPAKLRLKFGGGAAGHNGLKSMDEHLGTDQYHRMRLGIGHPGSKDRVSDYVLSNFSKQDEEWLEKLLLSIAKHFGDFLSGHSARFASSIASDMAPPKPKPEKMIKPEGQENGI